MALMVVNNGQAIAMGCAVNKTTPEDLVLFLWTNNVTPGPTDTLSTYTQASGYSYADATLTGASWSLSGGSPEYATYAQQSWTFSGALGNVYGYGYKRASSGDLFGAERFSDGPYLIANSGDQILVNPSLSGNHT